jgi:2-polyprenyl-6-hydroxyphenyl methylase/3-demethylubiquinone-9 3-methyltransferase
MNQKPFYEETEPKKASKGYLRAQDNLYDKYKVVSVKKLLDGVELNNLKILEVGCGGGFWTKFFAESGAKVTAVDMQNNLIEAAKYYLSKEGLERNCEFICGDATTLKLSKKFDLLFAKDIIEHIKDDDGFLRNMRGHLRQNGKMVTVTQNSLSLNYLIEGGVNRLIRRNRNWCGWDPTHVRFYTYWSLKNKLEKAGFTPLKWSGSYHIPYRFGIGKLYEHRFKLFHCLEVFGDYFPVDRTGWSIGVICIKR